MCNIKQLVTILLFSALFNSGSVYAQQKGLHTFILYAGGGWFSYIGPIGSPGIGSNTSVSRSYPTGTFRIMWHPDHRLRFGIESGYTSFYTYTVHDGSTSGKVNLTGIPILLVWSMALTKRLNVFAGVGTYLLTTDLNYKGSVKSKAFSLGINASVNYVQPVSPKWGIGAELKWTDAIQTKDYGISAQILLVWKFLE